VQANAVGDEAPIEDIDHDDAREQSPLVALATTPLFEDLVENVSFRGDKKLMNISCLQIQVYQTAIKRYKIARKNKNGSRQCRI